jgi:predicted lipid-binding transport protein (Tim44 family)
MSNGGLLAEGLSDAIGFFVGALVAALLARLIGFDFLEPGYGVRVLIGLLMVGLGGGLGLQLARRWRARRQDKNKDDDRS